ncbi:sensor histidine kinase [Amycolatopsis pigmentata]|uniref:histidine kinase n=1 Tax=Amycolatopsis pigmentata TaxID=450801 RepID=A0ABW5FXV9_9PSEU
MSRAWLPPVFRSARWGMVWNIALATMLFVFSFVPGVEQRGIDLAAFPDRRPLDALGLLLMVAQTLPLVGRLRWPLTCLVVTSGAFAAFQLLGYPTLIASLGWFVAFYNAGAHLSRSRQRIAIPAALVAYVALAVATHAAGSPEQFMDYVTFGAVLAVLWFVGAEVRAAAAAAAERQRRAEEAVVHAERARIARELHDVVTHHVTAMAVQADAAQYLMEQPEKVTASLSSISGTARRALTELRYLLGALDGNAQHGQEPVAGKLADLVAQSQAAGQPVELVEHGEPRPMASAAEVAAYRVVQEALTNALKHAPGKRTVVNVHHRDDCTDLEVTSERAGRAGIGRGSGRGLVGLRERVSVVGGELHAGPRPDGGFAVSARIPRGLSS